MARGQGFRADVGEERGGRGEAEQAEQVGSRSGGRVRLRSRGSGPGRRPCGGASRRCGRGDAPRQPGSRRAPAGTLPHRRGRRRVPAVISRGGPRPAQPAAPPPAPRPLGPLRRGPCRTRLLDGGRTASGPARRAAAIAGIRPGSSLALADRWLRPGWPRRCRADSAAPPRQCARDADRSLRPWRSACPTRRQPGRQPGPFPGRSSIIDLSQAGSLSSAFADFRRARPGDRRTAVISRSMPGSAARP